MDGPPCQLDAPVDRDAAFCGGQRAMPLGVRQQFMKRHAQRQRHFGAQFDVFARKR